MKRRKAKGFDCIEFKRQAQAEIYEEIKGLSPQEEIEYFRRQAATGPLGKWWNALERRPETAAPPASASLNHTRSAHGRV
jgi:hypothetical protein